MFDSVITVLWSYQIKEKIVFLRCRRNVGEIINYNLVVIQAN